MEKKILRTVLGSMFIALFSLTSVNAANFYVPSYLSESSQSGTTALDVQICYDNDTDMAIESWYWDGYSKIYLVPNYETWSQNPGLAVCETPFSVGARYTHADRHLWNVPVDGQLKFTVEGYGSDARWVLDFSGMYPKSKKFEVCLMMSPVNLLPPGTWEITYPVLVHGVLWTGATIGGEYPQRFLRIEFTVSI